MQARQLSWVLVAGVLAWSPGAAVAQPAECSAIDTQISAQDRQQMRFRGMDRDGDGVVTQSEWRGNDNAFRRVDRNGDGVLSGSELEPNTGRDQTERSRQLIAVFERADRNGNGVLSRAEWTGDRAAFNRADADGDGVVDMVEYVEDGTGAVGTSGATGPFNAIDENGNGVITLSEWRGSRDDFLLLDRDGDRVLTRDEFRDHRDHDVAESRSVVSSAYRTGCERGFADGREAGRADKTINGGRWDLEGQRELETADAGYTAAVGSHEDYQSGYRAGFRAGYRQGFGPR